MYKINICSLHYAHSLYSKTIICNCVYILCSTPDTKERSYGDVDGAESTVKCKYYVQIFAYFIFTCRATYLYKSKQIIHISEQ